MFQPQGDDHWRQNAHVSAGEIQVILKRFWVNEEGEMGEWMNWAKMYEGY